MIRTVGGPLALALALALSLGACNSARFAGGPEIRAPLPPRAAAPEIIEPVEAAPSGSVSSAPLPPIGGGPAFEPEPVEQAQNLPLDTPSIAQPEPLQPPPQRAAVTAGGRSSYVGGWNARDAAGGTCRVQLASTPALDLYRASAGNCANRDLARVSAWDFRDGEIYLYQPGGTVAARLRPSGGAMEGVLAKSGAPLSLAR